MNLFYVWLRKSQEAPNRLKAPVMAGVFLLLAGLHWFWGAGDPARCGLVSQVFVLPLLAAAVWWGLMGGLAFALVASLAQLPCLLGHAPSWPAEPYLAAAQFSTYFVLGALVGYLAKRERIESRFIRDSESLTLIGKAAATVAHELKSPLVAIGGFAQRMHQQTDPGHPHHRHLGIMVGQVRHMETLLREMLDYSRPLQLELGHQQISPLVEEVLALAAAMAQKAGVELATECSDRARWVLLDGPRLKQVLLNLVSNAVQASRSGGRVLVRTDLADQGLLIEVVDNGKGIAAEHLDNIFSPFFTTKAQGTGLGLAICMRIVEAHQGRISVASRPEAGTTFRVLLPKSVLV